MISWTGLLVLCSTLSPALCCDWLRHYGHYSNMSLSLLRLMGGQVTEQESPVPFPYRFYISIRTTEVRSQVVFVRDSLVQIADLYRHGNLSSVTWDTDRTNGFRMSLDRQIDELRSCTKDQASMNQQKKNSLRKYYKKLRTRTLEQTGGGSAYWQLIRKETQLHLEQLDLLVNSIRSSVVSTSVQG
ncbi:interferon a3-like [Echeneis naucrates]|uniref:interferon a3-like n=1 Tax=Echeneis naucrates TaxID=173247 RepID=UPI001113C646|nr:interferon a3-like [Echeneis naucrates]